MDIRSIQKYEHTSPRKMRLVADMVRSLKPARALNQLQFAGKAAAEPLAKAIKTALANAKQQNLNEEQLAFKSIEINEGPKLRRANFVGRGRVNPYKKRMSHIRIILTDERSEEIKGEIVNG